MIRNYPAGYPLPFVGRTKELAEIGARLQEPSCRLLTLTGLGGSGKTRLALEAAKLVEPLFPDGAVFVGLQSVARSDSLVPAIGQAVGLPFFGRRALQDQLLDYLRDRDLLLILDNFEHLLDVAVVVKHILVQSPHVKVLATSREALSLREEWLYPVQGLAAPPSVYAYVGSLEEYEAAQLFLYHARRTQPGFDAAREHEAIVRICSLTAGLPLAIELAASWLKVSSAAQIARHMQDSLTFLSTTLRDVEERHRSMRVVFDQTWELLPANERLIFAKLSVFRGGFDGDAAARVAGAAFADLAALIEKALVQLEAPDRFGVHELLRQYGTEKLEEYRATAATADRHSHYFAQQMLQHETALRQPHQLATIQAIERDFENIRLA
jgi:predicted ATPase